MQILTNRGTCNNHEFAKGQGQSGEGQKAGEETQESRKGSRKGRKEGAQRTSSSSSSSEDSGEDESLVVAAKLITNAEEKLKKRSGVQVESNYFLLNKPKAFFAL